MPKVLIKRGVLPARLQQARILSKDLVARVTGDAGEAVVDIQNGAFGVGDGDALEGVAEHLGCQLLLKLGALGLGHILERAVQHDHLLPVIEFDLAAHQADAVAAVRSHDVEFQLVRRVLG